MYSSICEVLWSVFTQKILGGGTVKRLKRLKIIYFWQPVHYTQVCLSGVVAWYLFTAFRKCISFHLKKKKWDIISVKIMLNFLFHSRRSNVASLAVYYQYLHGKCSDALPTLVPTLQKFKPEFHHAISMASNQTHLCCIPFGKSKLYSQILAQNYYCAEEISAWMLSWALHS